MCIPLRRETLGSGVTRLTARLLGENNFAFDVAKPSQDGIGFSDGRRKVRNVFVAC